MKFLLSFNSWRIVFSGVIICSTIVPDTNPTPPLEFPSDNLHVRIVQATDSSVNNNLTKAQFMYYGNDVETTTSIGTTSQSLDKIDRELNNVVFKSWHPINVITKISENYTENKYYNNRIEENWSSITLTLLVLTVIAIIVLACSILFLKKVQK